MHGKVDTGKSFFTLNNLVYYINFLNISTNNYWDACCMYVVHEYVEK